MFKESYKLYPGERASEAKPSGLQYSTGMGFAPKVPKMTDFRCRIWTLGASVKIEYIFDFRTFENRISNEKIY